MAIRSDMARWPFRGYEDEMVTKELQIENVEAEVQP
jgi:hypothetical protein